MTIDQLVHGELQGQADHAETVALMRMGVALPAPIGNYYGAVELVIRDGEWHMRVGSHRPPGHSSVPVSHAFALAFIAEFNATTSED